MNKDIHKFYTGFSWDEIKLIAEACRRCFKTRVSLFASFDAPEYGGLPEKISNRLRPDQVDILNSEGCTTAIEVARGLAIGYGRDYL